MRYIAQHNKEKELTKKVHAHIEYHTFYNFMFRTIIMN